MPRRSACCEHSASSRCPAPRMAINASSCGARQPQRRRNIGGDNNAPPKEAAMARPATAVALFALVAASALAAEPPYDLVIRNGRIVDGTGSPWYRADIAVRGDTIVRIAPSITENAVRTID